MYADHQPLISKLGRSDAQGFLRVATFAVCTIRVHLHTAVADLPYALAGEPCTSIFGQKHDALAALRRGAPELHEELEYLFEFDASPDALLRVLMTVPGLGLAKAGFTLQMIYGISGCIDTHNIARFNLPARQFQSGQKSVDRRRIPAYNAMVDRLGGTEALWDDWCEYVAARDGSYLNADHVSQLHLAPLHISNAE